MNMKDMLNTIRIYQLCAVDLNLYLDNFPDDKNAREDYCKVSAKLTKLMADYEKNYGPLVNFGQSYDENPSLWVNQCWPWENKE